MMRPVTIRLLTRRGKKVWEVDFRIDHVGVKLPRTRRDIPPLFARTKRDREDWAEKTARAFYRECERIESGVASRDEIPTLQEWFFGRFWAEQVEHRNGASEKTNKRSVFKYHLSRFADLKLDKINETRIEKLKGDLLVDHAEKSVVNILATLKKAMAYAKEKGFIRRMPDFGLETLGKSPPEMKWFEIGEYARLLATVRERMSDLYLAVLLAGETGMRLGEIKALQWAQVDMVGRSVTVNRQRRQGQIGPPKGKKTRVVPMTEPLYHELQKHIPRRFNVVLVGGKPMTDGSNKRVSTAYSWANLPKSGWHTLRHTFGTHCALLGVNPWRLMAWMGHKSIETTMHYVHMAENHRRPLPENIVAAMKAETDPDSKIIVGLGLRIGVNMEAPPSYQLGGA